MKEREYNLYIGCSKAVNALEDIAQACIELDIEGLTIEPVKGYWRGELEESLRITISGPEGLKLRALAQILGRKWSEEYIIITERELSSFELLQVIA